MFFISSDFENFLEDQIGKKLHLMSVRRVNTIVL